MRIRHKNRCGFATVMAMVSLTLVGIAVGGLMTHLSIQSRRTMRDADRAQQEQIRIAKSLGADVKLPDELLHSGVAASAATGGR